MNDADSFEQILSDVAASVDLEEGEMGVRQVIQALGAAGPASVRAISRKVGLPVPVVAAINNELRARGLLVEDRPARLSPLGDELMRRFDSPIARDCTCPTCDGRGLVIPSALDPLVERLREVMEEAPPVDVALDQSHATPETKVRRLLYMIRAGLSSMDSLLLLGDDDLVSTTIVAAGELLEAPLVRRLVVVDISSELLRFLERFSSRALHDVDLVQHDLRDPLPDELVGRFHAAMTDPPYTSAGARLFLSRAIEGLRPGPNHSIFFSYGPKAPDAAADLNVAFAELGLATVAVTRRFNEYEGSGIIGGTGHLYELATTRTSGPAFATRYEGAIYTGESRRIDREYKCVDCGETLAVGPSSRWKTIRDLQAHGCPRCGNSRFRPLQLERSDDGERRR